MMSEIEKLYENAGIKGEWRDYRVKNGKVYDGKNPNNRNIRLCKPCFTAEKQLSLIKCLLTKVIDTEHIHLEFSDRTFKFLIHSVACSGDDCDTLENALCSYINNLWQDLTEEDKTSIKNILEM